MVVLRACTVVCSILGFASWVAAGQANLAWNPSPEATGYIVYWGSASGQYSFFQDVADTTTTVIGGIQDCVPTFFMVTAYNAGGESDPSNEIVHHADPDGDGVGGPCDAYPTDAARSGPMFTDSVDIDDVWRVVNLPSIYQDPIVIAGPPTFNGRDPGVIRIRNITQDSFEIRFREWRYLDKWHSNDESVSFLVMERGRETMADGSIWEADSFTVSDTGIMTSRSFSQPFPGRPALLLTVQSNVGGTPVAVRARGLGKNGFSAALFEEEALMDGHDPEDVGYLAVWSHLRSGSVAVNGVTLPYALQTVELNHKFQPVLAWSLRLEEEKSLDPETSHIDETTSVLALGSHLFAQDVATRGANVVALRRLDPDVGDGMEWGMLSGVRRKWLTVPLAKSYVDPVVIVKPVSNDGSVPGVIRLRNIDTDSFDVRMHAWTYLGTADSEERAFYFVCDAGQHEMAGLTVEAGKIATNATVAAGNWAPVTLQASFGSVPAVLAAVQTFAGQDPVVTRITGRDASGFSLAMDEEEGLNGAHTQETIGWVAIEPGVGVTSGGRSFEVFTTIAGSDTTSVDYLQNYSGRFPTVVSDISSAYDQDACFLRHESVSATSVDLFIMEEQSMDPEMVHAMEDISVLVAE